MIHIVRGQANTVALSLREKQQLTNPYFLFRFTSESRLINKVFIAHDISSYPLRANIFTITESATEVPLSGTVELNSKGFWDYEVWEQASATNLNPALATTLLETGIVKVIGTDQNTFTQYGGNTTQYTEYNGS